MRLAERFAFLLQLGRAFHETGAVQPSSRFLARAMTEPLRARRRDDPSTALRIVEMGPGTGAVTRAIAAAMGPEDVLDCYEINPAFADYLRRRIARDRAYRPAAERIRVHTQPAQHAPRTPGADFVVCSVPLNNLTGTLAREILEHGLALLHDRGVMTYFEYPVLPALRSLLADAETRRRIRAVAAAKSWANRFAIGSALVVRNVPPARAVHLSPHTYSSAPSAFTNGHPRHPDARSGG